MMILFLIIFLVCIGFIFSRPVESYEVLITEKNEWDRVELSPSALTIAGMGVLGSSWRKYPEYTTGLGIAAGLSLIGAAWCVYNIERKPKRAEE